MCDASETTGVTAGGFDSGFGDAAASSGAQPSFDVGTALSGTSFDLGGLGSPATVTPTGEGVQLGGAPVSVQPLAPLAGGATPTGPSAAALAGPPDPGGATPQIGDTQPLSNVVTGTQPLDGGAGGGVLPNGVNPGSTSSGAFPGGAGAINIPGAGTLTAPGPAAAPAGPSFGDKALGFAEKNPGLLLGAGLLGANVLRGQPQPSQNNDLTQIAQQLKDQQSQLTAPLLTGKLPAGAQAAVDQATQAAVAGVRSKHAGQGTSGSPMEAQEIASIQQRAPVIAFQIAQTMADTGLRAAGLSDQIYSQLINETLQQDQELSGAIANFAGAAAGGGAKIRIG